MFLFKGLLNLYGMFNIKHTVNSQIYLFWGIQNVTVAIKGAVINYEEVQGQRYLLNILWTRMMVAVNGDLF